ncbi:hypothetical protein CPSG_08520 [Coccidioides posadasii str. Silveira]|uniref:Uncharacterized protein n=1 Tax=Coccidioides posadasii (strain RMSCC 757 / Silveira) TaxID=443226 RepID=E9DFK5_COCPS|nr:hypothetical protein CPSG_08520 [Coccidioides posadasii str. Silveira]
MRLEPCMLARLVCWSHKSRRQQCLPSTGMTRGGKTGQTTLWLHVKSPSRLQYKILHTRSSDRLNISYGVLFQKLPYCWGVHGVPCFLSSFAVCPGSYMHNMHTYARTCICDSILSPEAALMSGYLPSISATASTQASKSLDTWHCNPQLSSPCCPEPSIFLIVMDTSGPSMLGK